MELKLWKNFKKRINSTKQPADAEATVLDVVFKDSTSIENPILLIEGIDLDYNYCKLAGHYYYINDIIVVNNELFELHCIQDQMATKKADILAMDAYVEYASSIYNKWIPDTRLQSLNDVVTNSAKFPIFVNDNQGSYILTVAGRDEVESHNATIAFANYYCISATNARTLADRFYSNELIEQVKRFFGDNIMNGLIEAHWVPWQVGASGSTIKIGNIDTGIVANGLASLANATPETYEIDVPWIYNDWRDMPPYAVMMLYLPYYGTIQLDQSKFAGVDKLTVQFIKDALTGEVIYWLSCNDWHATYRADAAVALAVGQTSGKKVQAISQAVVGAGAIIGGIATINAGSIMSGLTMSAGGAIGGLGGAAATFFSQETTGSGGTGGFGSGNMVLQDAVTGDKRQVMLTLYARSYATTPTALQGLEGNPVMGVNHIGDLSGFVKCAGASVNTGGLGSDKDVINQHLNNGFYIE